MSQSEIIEIILLFKKECGIRIWS